MNKYRFKRILIYISVLMILFSIMSCPEPITEDVVAKVQDTGSPSIIVSTPSDNSIYRSSVTFEGQIRDDSSGSIENFSFNVPNQLIGGGVLINSGNVSQDASEGDTIVSFTPSNGAFSFTFSTIDPDVITANRLLVNLTATDWNGNTSEETITLYENEDGPYIELTGLDNDTVYDGSDIDIEGKVMDFEVPAGDPVSVENLKYIKWRLYSSPPQTYTISIPPEPPAAGQSTISATEFQNSSFYYNTETGVFRDVVKTDNQTGSLDFELIAEDLNEHINKLEYTLSDGNYSPGMSLSSTIPSAYTDSVIYFSSSDTLSADFIVGPTNKSFTYTYNFIAQSGANGNMTLVNTQDNGGGIFTYTYRFTESASGFDLTSPNQAVSLTLEALGASSTSSGSVMFTHDAEAPAVFRHNVASGAGIKNTYVDFEIEDSSDADSDPDLLWGSRYRASSITASDLEIVKLTAPSETIAISSIQEITDFDSPVPGAVSGGTGTFRVYISNKDDISYKDGLTDYTLRSKSSSVTSSTVALDKANNVLSNYNFVFLDEAAPLVDTLTPSHTAVTSFSGANMTLQFNEGNLNYSGTNNITVTKDGTPSTVTGSITTTSLSDDTLSIPFPGGDGVYTVSVPSGVVTDISANPFTGLSAAQWNFTVDTQDPEVGTITAQIGGAGSDITGTLIPAPASNIVFTINLSDTSTLSKGSGDLIQLVRSSSSDVDINMSSVTLTGSTAAVSVNSSYFTSDEDYHLRLLEGAFIDVASNPSPLTNGNTFTVDADPPSVDSITAEVGGAGGDVTNSIIHAPSSDIEFTISMSDSTTISKGTGDLIQLLRNSSPVLNINMDSVTLSASTATLTIAGSNFTSDGDYNLRVLAGAFTDSASNTSVQSDGNTFEVDDTPPAVDTISAKIDGAGSDITGTIIQAPSSNIDFTVTLSDNTSLSKGSGDLMQLVRSSSSDININMSSVELTGSTATVTVNSSVFASDEDYHLRLLEGAFLDEASNPSPLTNGSTFKVDDTAPAVTSIAAEIGGAGGDITGTTITSFPSSDIEFTINLSDYTAISKGTGTLIELVRGTSANVDIDMSSVSLSGSTATLTVSKDYFTNDEAYSLRVNSGAFIDAALNSVDQFTEDSFTVDTKPYVIDSSRSPANGSYTNDTSPTVSFDFDENVSTGTGTNAGKVSVGGTYYTASESSGSITFTLPDDTLADGSTYSVAIDADAFKDVDGTEHFCDAYSGWSFTVDTADPTVNEPTSPASGYTYITAGTVEVVFTLTDASDIAEKAGGATVVFDCSGTDVNCTDVVVLDAAAGTVRARIPTSSLAEDTTYNLKVSDDEFVDQAGNGNNNGPSSFVSAWSITINLVP